MSKTTAPCKYLVEGDCSIKFHPDKTNLCPKKRLQATPTIYCHRAPIEGTEDVLKK